MGKLQSFLLMLCGICAVASAAPLHQTSIPVATANADLVLVGEVITVDASRTEGSLTLVPIETLKGEVRSGPVRVSYRGFQINDAAAIKAKRTLLFAKRDAVTQEFVLLPLMQGGGLIPPLLEHQILATDLNVPVPATLRKTDSDSVLQKVAKEVGLFYLTSGRPDAFLYFDTLAGLRQEPELAKLIYKLQLQSSEPDGMLKATVGLLRLGDVEGLESVDRASGKLRDDLRSQLGIVENTYLDKSARSIEILKRWFQGTQPAERYTAAGALANIHTKQAILALGPALDDPNFEIRWRAIGGISLFANNAMFKGGSPVPGPWSFRSDDTIRYSVFDRDFLLKQGEAEHLAFWKRWWAENRSKIQGLAE